MDFNYTNLRRLYPHLYELGVQLSRYLIYFLKLNVMDLNYTYSLHLYQHLVELGAQLSSYLIYFL